MNGRLGAVALAWLAALVAASAAAHAASVSRPATPRLIERAAGEGRIERDTATLYLAYALGRPDRLPAAYRSDTPWDGTLPLRRLREAVPKMARGPRREEAESIAEPEASTSNCGTSSTILINAAPTDHFHVEYTTAGGGLAIADYLTSLEEAWSTEVTSFGWAAPPAAPTPPPGGRYHVRVDALGPGLYGFVSNSGTHAGLVGDNPSTAAWNEGDAYASCMVLNSDFSGFPSSPQDSLDATTAHEFNHSLQYGYGALTGANKPDDAFVEGGATWMEDEVQDAADDNYFYLWPAFSDGLGDYDGSPYDYWIAFRGLTERFGAGTAGGAEQVMQDFWEETSRNTGDNLTALQTALGSKGTTLADAFHAYAIAVKFNKACGGGYALPYCFEEGPGYVASAGATAVHRTLTSVGSTTPNTSVEDDYALSWVALPASGGPYDVTLENRSAVGGQLRGTVACDTGTALALAPLPAVAGPSQSTTLAGYDPSGCAGAPVAVVTNQYQTAANPTNSASRNYRVGTEAVTPTHTLSVTRAGSGTGTVTSSPPGIDCGLDCLHDYDEGDSVTLTATPAAGSRFDGWSGDCAGSGGCAVAMTAARSVTATFVAQHLLTVATVGGGGVSSSPAGIDCGSDCLQAYDEGTPVTLTATPAAGWHFEGWSGAGCSGTGTCQVTMSAARDVTATFAEDPPGTFSLSVVPSGTGTGTVSSAPAGIDCGADCSETYVDGTLVTLTATPAAGSSFGGWSGACSGTGGCQVTMDAARSVGAAFVADPPPAGTPAPPSASTSSPATSPITAPIAAPSIDGESPRLTLLRIAPAGFPAAARGPSARAAAAGAIVRWVLSEPATVAFRVERAARGRRVGGGCARPTAANRRRAPCVRWVLLRGGFAWRGVPGANRFRFTGRLAGRALVPGPHRLVARATDPSRNRGPARRARFQVVRAQPTR